MRGHLNKAACIQRPEVSEQRKGHVSVSGSFVRKSNARYAHFECVDGIDHSCLQCTTVLQLGGELSLVYHNLSFQKYNETVSRERYLQVSDLLFQELVTLYGCFSSGDEGSVQMALALL